MEEELPALSPRRANKAHTPSISEQKDGVPLLRAYSRSRKPDPAGFAQGDGLDIRANKEPLKTETCGEGALERDVVLV